MDNLIKWTDTKPIRELINQLIDLEVKGYSEIKLNVEQQSFEPDGDFGTIDYEYVVSLEVI